MHAVLRLTFILAAIVIPSALFAQKGTPEEEARKLIKELTAAEKTTLTNDERLALARAYNEIGKDQEAVDAIIPIPEPWLNANNALKSKMAFYHNMLNEPNATKYYAGYLAFLDRCLENKMG